ncbi:MAG: glutamate formimidoyltransferase [Deltaproteobacteria bacterium CG_4_10_14_0_2_um_filter_43_8]|nr:MAG: glutamate formimidoyltransferase [Deltaproteobacteria bacterium CG11_big_fil_rev_8_21_14_0_20_42_23]PJA18722.1 MAG: glutamate formimidoyltransferase [Deltaproteobacteria bacterium CG_4_10_14_0_2_um_filter_43_8]PJC64603.1 MAG: glutamate formimidoyltransferase [Deltaproteobacteria bacterium CG_4_9_14_0_2_um_filter_42_21]
MPKQLIECVPNISEGKDFQKLERFADCLKNVPTLQLLHLDADPIANRTVMSFVVSPHNLEKAATALYSSVLETIDMRQHHGLHPRMGAIDVFPLVPFKNISLEECIAFSLKMAKKIGEEFSIPVFMYAYSTQNSLRQKLHHIRKGEFENLAQKLSQSEWKPDYGPITPHPTFGATAIGARELMIAFNVGLNTKDLSVAQHIAAKLRESGSGGKPGLFKGVQAMGWIHQAYNCTQVSMNLHHATQCSLYSLFSEIEKLAKELGTTVKGSEIVGIVPKASLLEQASSYEEAIQKLKLNALRSFDPKQQVIEEVITHS